MNRRVRVALHGAVQGVGFRPFVYRLATDLALEGWVSNGPGGVIIDVEGARPQLQRFLHRLGTEHPPRASIHGRETFWLDPVGHTGFVIRESDTAGDKTAVVLPDLAPCAECVRELVDPTDRRYGYPFINCTNCGPRFSIIQALPYDRTRTSMRGFRMCPACQAEYDDPASRRFHAQPNACPACGPQLALWSTAGIVLTRRAEALEAAAAAVESGAVLALKGVGGFHLIVDATNAQAVARLRKRKQRRAKPFAVLCASLEMAQELGRLNATARQALMSPQRPIVLLRRRADAGVADAVAPDNPWLGVLMPPSPLHELLARRLQRPLVATSGNLAEEPLCIDESQALRRLGGLAEVFLVHDRPIVRPVDDSVVRVLLGRELLVRRARGFAPLPVPLAEAPVGTIAVGGQLKSTVAVAIDGGAVVSQHLGDLENPQTVEVFEQALADLTTLYEVRPARVACDQHPDYHSTHWARSSQLPLTPVQHHEAHIRACLADNALAPPVLGVAWDGTGYGEDGTIWGGEFLWVTARGAQRLGSLRPFPLPGGEHAIREPRRCALGVLHALWGEAVFDDLPQTLQRAFKPTEIAVLRTMLRRGVHAPLTSSAGRLFDAVAALIGFEGPNDFEGHGALWLEGLAQAARGVGSYPCALAPDAAGLLRVDWGPMILAILDDLRRETPTVVIAARFHDALAQALAQTARQLGAANVALSGGCFQNATLTVRAVQALRACGCRPYWHQRLPPNDGGLAIGQLGAMAARMGAA